MDEITRWLWAIISTLGGAAVVIAAIASAAYWLFQIFTEKWLASKFDAQLARLQHAHEREIESFRGKISAHMDRTMKLQQREYEVLPVLWEKLADAYADVMLLTSQSQRITDASNMNDADLENFLATTPLLPSQKDQVRSAPRTDRTQTLERIIYWYRADEVQERLRAAARYLRFQGIFVLDEINDDAKRLVDLLWSAHSESQSNRQLGPPSTFTDHERLRAEGKALLDGIEARVKARLWTITAETAVVPPA
jgi:hypothetical protein